MRFIKYRWLQQYYTVFSEKLHSKKTWGLRAIYAFDKDGNYEKYDTISKFAKKINRSHSAVSIGIKGGRKIAGYKIITANDLEDNQGKIDEIKLKEIIDNL